MKYYFVSDVHGCYDSMIKALNEHGFDKDKDTIVSVGDLFDRGTQSKEVLSFFMSCPHRILIWGNHDIRLQELYNYVDIPDTNDFYNGILPTIQSFVASDVFSISSGLYFLQTEKTALSKMLEQYFSECVFAAEWSDLIAVHSWLPIDYIETTNSLNIDPYWRRLTVNQWKAQIFRNGCRCFHYKIFPEKTLLVGHMFSWLYKKEAGFDSYKLDEKGNIIHIDSDPFISDELIAIDGCAVAPEWGGKVNVVVKETDETPILYKGEPEYEHFID